MGNVSASDAGKDPLDETHRPTNAGTPMVVPQNLHNHPPNLRGPFGSDMRTADMDVDMEESGEGSDVKQGGGDGGDGKGTEQILIGDESR